MSSTRAAVNFIIFCVSDLEASFKYFTETLGFEADLTQNSPVFRGFASREGTTPFGLFLASEAAIPGSPQPGSVRIYFETDKLEEMRDELVAKGAEPAAIEVQPFGSIFHIPAPDGLLVTMLRPPAQ